MSNSTSNANVESRKNNSDFIVENMYMHANQEKADQREGVFQASILGNKMACWVIAESDEKSDQVAKQAVNSFIEHFEASPTMSKHKLEKLIQSTHKDVYRSTIQARQEPHMTNLLIIVTDYARFRVVNCGTGLVYLFRRGKFINLGDTSSSKGIGKSDPTPTITKELSLRNEDTIFFTTKNLENMLKRNDGDSQTLIKHAMTGENAINPVDQLTRLQKSVLERQKDKEGLVSHLPFVCTAIKANRIYKKRRIRKVLKNPAVPVVACIAVLVFLFAALNVFFGHRRTDARDAIVALISQGDQQFSQGEFIRAYNTWYSTNDYRSRLALNFSRIIRRGWHGENQHTINGVASRLEIVGYAIRGEAHLSERNHDAANHAFIRAETLSRQLNESLGYVLEAIEQQPVSHAQAQYKSIYTEPGLTMLTLAVNPFNQSTASIQPLTTVQPITEAGFDFTILIIRIEQINRLNAVSNQVALARTSISLRQYATALHHLRNAEVEAALAGDFVALDEINFLTSETAIRYAAYNAEIQAARERYDHYVRQRDLEEIARIVFRAEVTTDTYEAERGFNQAIERYLDIGETALARNVHLQLAALLDERAQAAADAMDEARRTAIEHIENTHVLEANRALAQGDYDQAIFFFGIAEAAFRDIQESNLANMMAIDRAIVMREEDNAFRAAQEAIAQANVQAQLQGIMLDIDHAADLMDAGGYSQALTILTQARTDLRAMNEFLLASDVRELISRAINGMEYGALGPYEITLHDAERYMVRGEWNNAIRLFELAHAGFNAAGNLERAAHTRIRIAAATNARDQAAAAYEYTQSTAAERAEQLRHANAYLQQGNVEYNNNRFPAAILQFQLARDHFTALGMQSEALDAATRLSAANAAISRADDAERDEQITRGRDTVDRANAALAPPNRNFDAARSYFQLALRIFQELGMELEATSVDMRLAQLDQQQQEYERQQDRNETDASVLEMRNIAMTYERRANDFFDAGNYELARANFMSAQAHFANLEMALQVQLIDHRLEIIEQRLQSNLELAVQARFEERHNQAIAHVNAGHTQRALNNYTTAEISYMNARSIFRELGLLLYVDEMDHLITQMRTAETDRVQSDANAAQQLIANQANTAANDGHAHLRDGYYDHAIVAFQEAHNLFQSINRMDEARDMAANIARVRDTQAASGTRETNMAAAQEHLENGQAAYARATAAGVQQSASIRYFTEALNEFRIAQMFLGHVLPRPDLQVQQLDIVITQLATTNSTRGEEAFANIDDPQRFNNAVNHLNITLDVFTLLGATTNITATQNRIVAIRVEETRLENIANDHERRERGIANALASLGQVDLDNLILYSTGAIRPTPNFIQAQAMLDAAYNYLDVLQYAGLSNLEVTQLLIQVNIYKSRLDALRLDHRAELLVVESINVWDAAVQSRVSDWFARSKSLLADAADEFGVRNDLISSERSRQLQNFHTARGHQLRGIEYVDTVGARIAIIEGEAQAVIAQANIHNADAQERYLQAHESLAQARLTINNELRTAYQQGRAILHRINTQGGITYVTRRPSFPPTYTLTATGRTTLEAARSDLTNALAAIESERTRLSAGVEFNEAQSHFTAAQQTLNYDARNRFREASNIYTRLSDVHAPSIAAYTAAAASFNLATETGFFSEMHELIATLQNEANGLATNTTTRMDRYAADATDEATRIGQVATAATNARAGNLATDNTTLDNLYNHINELIDIIDDWLRAINPVTPGTPDTPATQDINFPAQLPATPSHLQ